MSVVGTNNCNQVIVIIEIICQRNVNNNNVFSTTPLCSGAVLHLGCLFSTSSTLLHNLLEGGESLLILSKFNCSRNTNIYATHSARGGEWPHSAVVFDRS